MADGILGLGSSGSLDLSQELLDKLKTAESTSILDPITTEIEDTETELEAVEEIQVMTNELLAIIEDFDLYTTGTSVFDEMSATTSGSSVSFTATDTSGLSEGSISVSVSQLAQKDVYQTDVISDITEEIGSGSISIAIGEESYTFTTDGKTYEELEEEMGYYTELDVALEQVSDDSYRLVIKSANNGLENGLTITQSDIDLGLENESNHVLSAQNLIASVDGIDYNLSSNNISMTNGLSITALEEGDSSITLVRDDTVFVAAVEDMVYKYNELVDLVDSKILGDEDDPAVISDSSTLKNMMSSIKEILFDSYGLDDEENLFSYGMSFDSDGYLELDSTELSSAISENYDDIKELFTGYAEKEGIGTRLKTYLDALDGYDGLLYTYEEKLEDSIDTLDDDYTEASEALDEKYESMATQFAAYTVLITEMETAFSSLEAIINEDD
ncbi:flagellar filament capping protein FliD [Poseidonibacter ostreae]|jgi:flagellar hook-associated protein 2|uniref:Flagellar hook-associated protein 2 n=1 Tax=Poseidonibacter ostreae TaxID=2654171 RepID=A0A6L4WVD6_9BACT|nr:flagellar filament capping protein FliD [Poseidonibacter ostreae]KAB7886825.1 flagellar filament capping protein FliD [Poseidonibacter ostreae]KAB7888747.1 flagellar filament capping protein FliD [Poseidonibacter ostreae]KAB7890468.1 flagellar filament capping protein FliD [Poseidonibacter ostreae]